MLNNLLPPPKRPRAIHGCLLYLLLGLWAGSLQAQSVAKARAQKMGKGMNISYLDNYWGGTKAKHFGDAFRYSEVAKKQPAFAEIYRRGFRNVRIPICFSAFMTLDKPYTWDFPQQLVLADSMVAWATRAGLVAVIDNHHPEFDGSFGTKPVETERLVWLWTQVANRYKNTNPEQVVFEIRNEPHGITPGDWRSQAEVLVRTIRAIAPQHTIMVGAEEWNGLDALSKFQPLDDANVLYTFHFYDPFIFTHQGASWTGAGFPELSGVGFPSGTLPPGVPQTALGTWVESAIRNYPKEGTFQHIDNRLRSISDWAKARNLPIYCGEFGSYNLRATSTSRCNHAAAVIMALGKYQIPFAWWEYDQGFSMFDTDGKTFLPCMLEAVALYDGPPLSVLPEQDELVLMPNPADTVLEINDLSVRSVKILDTQGREVSRATVTERRISLVGVAPGSYMLQGFDAQNQTRWIRKLIRQ
jgi:endoglucanase